jgi:SAM-dependent methyltransferase
MAANPFDGDQMDAGNYARARPYYHPLALAMAFERAPIDSVGRGLDVGCGTGLSTKALAERVSRVVAIDPSASMLGARERVGNAVYVRGTAENLPVMSGTVDVVTCGASMHWYRTAAFAELGRVTKLGGYAVVYTDFFHGDGLDRPGFETWMHERYLQWLPTPPRGSQYDEPAMERAGFQLLAHAERLHQISMTAQGLAAYLMSQSNATTALASGEVGRGELRERIESEIDQFFVDGAADARFGIRVWLAQKVLT